jgi:signal transduction histidine kinase
MEGRRYGDVLRRYGVAVGLSGLATALSLLQAQVTAPTPFQIFVAAVVGSVFYGGLGPGLLSTALGLLIGNAILFAPGQLLAFRASDLVTLGVFVVVALITGTLYARGRRATEEAMRLSRDAEQARAATEAERQRLFDVLQQAPAIIAIAEGPEHRFTFVNPTYLHVSNRRADQLLGHTVREAFPEFQDQAIIPILDGVYQTGVAFQGTEVPLRYDRNGDGRLEEACFNISVQPLRVGQEPATGVLMYGAEVTPLVEGRKAVEMALRDRDQFLAVAAHELRTPLTALLGNAQLVERRFARDGAPDERMERSVQTMVRQGVRLNALINDLLNLSRIDLGQFVITRAPFDLGRTLAQLVAEVEPVLERHPIALHLPPAEEVLAVEGDEPRLVQVFENLIQNAGKYSPAGAPITVTVTATETTVSVAVADRGIGIPAAAQAQLFTRFFRATNASERASGLGIGLYVVKEIVTRHAGSIAVTSVEGEGSTFTVTLPRAIGALASDGEPSDAHGEQAGARSA